MIPHLACQMVESSQIGDARRQAARLASKLEFNELAMGRMAIVVTELATNLVRHATDGLLLIGIYAQGDVATIELISIDRGPGMSNIDKSLSDGVSTAGTAGNGLGAVRRISSQFLIFSKMGFGSVIVARLTADNSTLNSVHQRNHELAYAGICIAAPGEIVSGDAWACQQEQAAASIVVADGLGHGPDAALAADAATQQFLRHVGASPRDLVERCHGALRTTRGAAVAAIRIDPARQSLAFCGVGNIAARILSGTEDRSLLSQHGTVGLQIRKLQEIDYALPGHAVVVAHTDGIATRWDLKDVPELLACSPIMLAAHLIRNKCRGRDDATVVVVQCN
ncbi:MAG: ATP-binding SpoIIE family protein phosphatase [Caldimonas sp.]